MYVTKSYQGALSIYLFVALSSRYFQKGSEDLNLEIKLK